MDPFKFGNKMPEISQAPPPENQFPDFNTKWLPQFEEGLKTKVGNNIEKGSDILKKAAGLYWFGLGLTILIVFLPAILRFIYGLSKYLFEKAGNIFP